jgi:hypothetical protein
MHRFVINAVLVLCVRSLLGARLSAPLSQEGGVLVVGFGLFEEVVVEADAGVEDLDAGEAAALRCRICRYRRSRRPLRKGADGDRPVSTSRTDSQPCRSLSAATGRAAASLTARGSAIACRIWWPPRLRMTSPTARALRTQLARPWPTVSHRWPPAAGGGPELRGNWLSPGTCATAPNRPRSAFPITLQLGDGRPRRFGRRMGAGGHSPLLLPPADNVRRISPCRLPCTGPKGLRELGTRTG